MNRLTGGSDDSGGVIGIGRALDAWGVPDASDVLAARRSTSRGARSRA